MEASSPRELPFPFSPLTTTIGGITGTIVTGGISGGTIPVPLPGSHIPHRHTQSPQIHGSVSASPAFREPFPLPHMPFPGDNPPNPLYIHRFLKRPFRSHR